MQRPDRAIAADNKLVAILCRERLNCFDDTLDERRESKVLKL